MNKPSFFLLNNEILCSGTDPPLAMQSKTDAFVGDAAPEAPPTPTTIKPAMHFPPPEPNASLPDDRRRVLEEQQAFLQNIMRATAAAPDQPSNPLAAGDDPFQAFMAQLAGGSAPFPQLGAGAGVGAGPEKSSSTRATPEPDFLQALMSNSLANAAAGGQAAPPAPPKPRSRLQKALPLIHLLAIWCLLAYFIWMKEPVMFDEKFVDVIQSGQRWSPWTRWAELLKGKVRNVHAVVSCSCTMQVGIVVLNLYQQFFPAFMALELVLHGWRAVTGLVSFFFRRPKISVPNLM
jgi:GET complex subunit GET2